MCFFVLITAHKSVHNHPMTARKVNLDLLETWLARNGGPKALAERSNVSRFTIKRVKSRRTPFVPRKRITQLLLADAIGVSVDELFPIDDSDRGESA